MTTVGTQDGNGPIEENFASEIDERPSEDIVTTKIPVVIRNSNTISQPKEETASSIKIEFTKEESEYEEANTTTISSHEEDGVFSNDMQPQRKRARVPKPRTYLGEEDDSPSLLRKGPSNSAKAAKPIQVLDSGEIDSADVLESDDLVASHLLLLSNAAADGEGEDTPSISSRPGSGRGGRGRRGRVSSHGGGRGVRVGASGRRSDRRGLRVRVGARGHRSNRRGLRVRVGAGGCRSNRRGCRLRVGSRALWTKTISK